MTDSAINLKALFATASSSDMTAQAVFTNRVSEVAAFETSLAVMRDRVSVGEIATGPPSANQNVLVYYGVGGIGKSTLLCELERRFLLVRSRPRCCLRIDFAADPFDLEALILRLRASLGTLGAHWHAFDLALTSYWERAHPGKPFREFAESSGPLRSISAKVGLPQQVEKTVDALLLSAPVPGLPVTAARAAGSLYRYIRQRVRDQHLLEDCGRLGVLVDAEATLETFSYLPHLLSWDLARIAPALEVVVFVDTYEVLQGRLTLDAENLFQRMVHLMPQVLFVITGRSRVTWAEAATGELDHTGVDKWPMLQLGNITQEPRQHLVGYLSDEDCHDHLRRAVTIGGGAPALPDAVRDRIVAGSAGLPLYLDLSIVNYLELATRSEGPPAEADFGGPLANVVIRTMRDLEPCERALLRGLSCVTSFDEAMMRAVAPAMSDADLRRFLRRAFVVRDDARAFAFSLHERLRETVVETNRDLSDGWSEREWKEAASRLLDELGSREVHPLGRGQGSSAFLEGLKLCRDHDLVAEWLVSAADSLSEAGEWLTFGLLPAQSGGGQWVSALSEGLRGILARRRTSLTEAAQTLAAAREHSDAMPSLRSFLDLHLGHAVRNLGHFADAAEVYARIDNDAFLERAIYWLADLQYLAGHFTTALDAVAHPGSTSTLRLEQYRLRGHILRAHALFDDALSAYRLAMVEANLVDSPAARAKVLTNFAETTCWTRPEVGLAFADDACEANSDVGNMIELPKALAARAIACADHHEAATLALQDAYRIIDHQGHESERPAVVVADIFVSAVNRPEAVGPLLETLGQITDRLGGYGFWLDLIPAWLGAPAPRGSSHEWIDGLPSVLDRWEVVRNVRLE